MGPLVALFLLNRAKPQAYFAKATVYYTCSADGRIIYDDALAVKIRNVETLIRLLPGIKLSSGNLNPAGWRLWGWITLIDKKGRRVELSFPPNAAVFSIKGRPGDYRASPGLRPYLVKLEKLRHD